MDTEGTAHNAPAAPPPASGPLAAMWGKDSAAPSASTSAATSANGTTGTNTPTPAPLQLSAAPSAATQAAPRKRRKKEPAPAANQGRLTFGAHGIGVAAPPPPPPPEPETEKDNEKKTKAKGKRKSDEHIVIDSDEEIVPIGPPAKVTAGRKRKNAATAAVARNVPASVPEIVALADDGFSILSPDSSPPRPKTGRKKAGAVAANGSQGSRGAAPGSQGSLPSGSRAVSPIPVDGGSGTSSSNASVVNGTTSTGISISKPAGPKKMTFVGDAAKPAHAFFSKRPAAAPAAPSSSPLAPPPDLPETAAAPAAAPTTAAAPAAVHSFFNLAGREQGVLKKGWGSVREGEEPRAPLPAGEWPQHVGHALVEAYDGRLPRRARPEPVFATQHEETASATPIATTSTTTSTLTSPSPPLPFPAGVAPFILEHPAIQAVFATTLAPGNREAWAELHRPRTAASVLGNELEASYLRDWLMALSVGRNEPRHVIRRIPRKKMNPDTAWIVDDLYGEPFTDDAYEDIPEPVDEPDFPLGGRPDTYPPIEYWIGNALLLTGPSGSGKSAAVHAAAAELGWDVFEVYPGIGKRTGTNVLALVGDVGKNHMVGEKKDSKDKDKNAVPAAAAKKKAAVASFFGGGSKKETSSGSSSDPITLDDTPVKPKPKPVAADEPAGQQQQQQQQAPPASKQSLILIDEADILYDDEATFWPAVVQLIAGSHRPVVITCNDLARIPRDSIPIHTTLYFEPPAPYLAQAYLGAIAAKHGVPTDAASLYAQSTRVPVDLVDAPLPPNGHEPALLFDLRSAIAQMQLERGRGHAASAAASAITVDVQVKENANMANDVDLGKMLRALEGLSFADAHVAPRAWARMDVLEIDRLEEGPDDVDGHRALLKPDTEHRPVLATSSHAGQMASALASLAVPSSPFFAADYNFGNYYSSSMSVTATAELDAFGAAYDRVTPLQLVQTRYVRHVLPALDEVVTLACRLLPHRSLFTETLPVLRQLVAADDMLEEADRAAVAAGEPRINRLTGRTMRGAARYERHVAMEEHGLGVLRARGLQSDW